jgi:hypothetical protein
LIFVCPESVLLFSDRHGCGNMLSPACREELISTGCT